MEKIMVWLNANWWVIVVVVVPVAAKVLNVVTKHASEASGLYKVALVLIDLLDAIKLTPSPVTLQSQAVAKAMADRRKADTQRGSAQVGVLFIATAIMGLVVLVLANGCSPSSIQAVRDTLPKVHSGLNLAAGATQTIMGPVCRSRADACHSKGITTSADCPPYLACYAARRSVELATQSAEDALLALDKALQACQAVQR